MSKKWAIVIGINQYDFLKKLNYAQQDAEEVKKFLQHEVGFERIYLFTDSSPSIGGKTTRPSFANLLRVVRDVFDRPFMNGDDQFWFFFSGHGIRHNGRDYLMPSDGDPESPERTAISINELVECLDRCGAGTSILILDACRNDGQKGLGFGESYSETSFNRTVDDGGVITFFSCKPSEASWEISELQRGAFTYSLLNIFRSQVEKAFSIYEIERELQNDLYELCRRYHKQLQTPHIRVSSSSQAQKKVLMQYSGKTDFLQDFVNSKPRLFRQIKKIQENLIEAYVVRKNFLNNLLRFFLTMGILSYLGVLLLISQKDVVLKNSRTIRAETNIIALASSIKNHLLISGSNDREVRLWDWDTGRLLKTINEASSVWSIAINPDENLLATGHHDNHLVKLWDIKTGRLVRTFNGHSDEVRSVAFSPDGNLVASASADKTVRLWQAKTGVLVKTFLDSTATVTSVVFSPDGKLLAAASDDQVVRVWDLDNSTLKYPSLKGHTDYVLSVAFSSDGKTLASGSADKTIRLWNVETGNLERTISGHKGWVWSVKFSPDSKKLASGSHDQTVILWDSSTGKNLGEASEHSNQVYPVFFDAGGKHIISGAADSTIRFWDVPENKSWFSN